LDKDLVEAGGTVSEANAVIGSHSAELMERSPFRIPSNKLAIWLFIIADAATFAAMLIAYGYLRNADPNWPRPFHSIVNVAVMTFILITSSLTVLMAVQSAHYGRKAASLRWMFVTAALGAVFAILHIREWLHLIDEGVSLSNNPWGSHLFGACFFGVTGLHLFHVVSGVVALLAVAMQYNRGRYNASHVETTGLYWHFVDLVWMFVVPLLYLLNLAH
jgi:cytochrome c oxidase subunit 3